MRDREKEPWVLFLEEGALWAEGPGGLRVKELVIKVRHTGALAVVKARRGDDHLVAFKGGAGLQSLSGKIRNMIKSGETHWRLDKYA